MSTGDADARVEQLDEHECWERLLGSPAGRLAFAARGRIEVVPLNYVVRGRSILFRIAETARLLTERGVPAAFEVDGWDSRSSWSVVAHGTVARTDDPAPEEGGGGAPWPPADEDGRSVTVRFTVSELTGRGFERHPLPDLLWSW
jgi:hypothetical protein